MISIKIRRYYGRYRFWNLSRYACRSTVESKNAVSIHYLKKQGCLHEGNNGTLSWSRDGVPTGAIGYRVKDNGIEFSYRSRVSDYDEWENVELFIQFDYTACNYGNQRTWFFALIVINELLLFIVEVNIFIAESAVS